VSVFGVHFKFVRTRSLLNSGLKPTKAQRIREKKFTTETQRAQRNTEKKYTSVVKIVCIWNIQTGSQITLQSMLYFVCCVRSLSMPFVDLPTNARLYYEDVGRGVPVIAVHGRLGTGRDHLGAVIDWLRAEYRVLAPTLRGYGQSEPKPRRFPHDFYHQDAADLLAFMDALHIDHAHIMGYSDGGEVALIAAGIQPQRFISVAVWGAVGYFGEGMRPYVQRSYPPTWIKPEEIAQHSITNTDAFVLEWISAMKHMIDRGGDVSLSLAPNITCPLLLMLGDEDKLNPEAYGRKFVAKTKHGRLRMFKCGHGVHEERWDEFKRLVAAFLKTGR
jgi:valacyclovir hydrolase